jgi:5-hydroxyisourate hydrolase-like protein (transthyretin family)/membrane protein implicated in regulation of membrane protease activity
MRLWLWRACSVALLSVLLWAMAPRFVDSWRMSVQAYPTPMLSQAVAQAQALDLLSHRDASVQLVAETPAPLIAYMTAEEPMMALKPMRVPWMERIERGVFHGWWIVALLLLLWRLIRMICGHVWLRRQATGVLNATDHRLVRGLISPVVTGWRKATIWLPLEAVEWPTAKLRAVCLHEMAHHARHDGAWQWLGWLTTSVWWWNPLAWLALRQLTSEAELSADESALTQEISAADYAQVLVEIAAGGVLNAPVAGVAMLGHNGIQNRVKALLSGAGQHGLLGLKSKLALVVLALATVMTAGVEVRYVLQAGKPSEPLTEVEKTLVERSLTVLEQQIEKLARVHVKLTETWSSEGKNPTRSPQPSVIEAWVDESARQSRTEYRPRVTQWTSGAAPWFIQDETEATDGTRGWSYDGRETGEVRFSNDGRDDFFSFWEARPRARDLRDLLQQVRASGFKKLGLMNHLIHSVGDRVRIERYWPGGTQIEVWEIDLKQGGLALFQQIFPKRPEPFSSEWSVQHWTALGDGTPYPARTHWRNYSSDGVDTFTRQVTSLEQLSVIPATLLAPPEKPSLPFVATDGVAKQGEWLETHFVHATTGKPVPKVKVLFEINSGKRTELISDAQGTLRIPLPKEEVKYLRYWGLKPGFVMQMVKWQRYGNPLKLPEVYETKLYPVGKPIGGIVVDTAGNPVKAAQIGVTHTGGERNWDVFADVHTHGNRKVPTNAEGRWSMSGLAEDLSGLIIRVEHPKYQRVAIGYEMATGQSLSSLRDGTSRVVLKSAGLQVRGLISDTNSKPVMNCTVTRTADHWGRFDEPNARTDAEGRFAVPVNQTGKEWFTFEAAGFAPQMVHFDVNTESASRPLVIQLQSGRVLKVQVVDELGKPLPGVRMIADRWQDKRTLWFETVTDAEGRIEWHGAPPDAVQWTLLNHEQALRDLPLIASETEQTVVLRPAIHFTGMVTDANTGMPVPRFEVTQGDTRRSAADIYWRSEKTETFHDGEFALDLWGLRFEYKLRITAEGYEPVETKLFTAKQQTETLAVKLKPRE